jgi:hypothetical protein
MKDVDFNKVLTSMIPLVLAAMWWVISSVNDLDKEIQVRVKLLEEHQRQP